MKQPVTTCLLEQKLDEVTAALRESAAFLEKLAPLSLAALDPAETMIVSVDVNNGFAVEGTLKSDEAAALIEPTVALLRRAKQAGFSTMAFCDRHTDASPEFKSFPPHCMAGSGEDAVPELLLRHLDHVIYKNSTNGLLAPGAMELLSGWRCFVVTGCLTEFCLSQFAIALRAWLNERNCGGEVIVPLSLIDSYDAPGHSALLHNLVHAANMAACGVTLVSGVE